MENEKVIGTEIISVQNHFENLGISLSDGRYVYMTYEDLKIILSEFDFDLIMKRTRNWLSLNIDDWEIQSHIDPRT